MRVLTASQREEAAQRLALILQNLLTQARSQAVAKFDELTLQYQHSAEELFQAAAKSHAANFQSRLDEIEAARRRTQEDSQAHQQRLDRHQQALSLIDDLLTQIQEKPLTALPRS